MRFTTLLFKIMNLSIKKLLQVNFIEIQNLLFFNVIKFVIGEMMEYIFTRYFELKNVY